jgi:hypothetical protein
VLRGVPTLCCSPPDAAYLRRCPPRPRWRSTCAGRGTSRLLLAAPPPLPTPASSPTPGLDPKAAACEPGQSRLDQGVGRWCVVLSRLLVRWAVHRCRSWSSSLHLSWASSSLVRSWTATDVGSQGWGLDSHHQARPRAAALRQRGTTMSSRWAKAGFVNISDCYSRLGLTPQAGDGEVRPSANRRAGTPQWSGRYPTQCCRRVLQQRGPRGQWAHAVGSSGHDVTRGLEGSSEARTTGQRKGDAINLAPQDHLSSATPPSKSGRKGGELSFAANWVPGLAR